MIAPFGTNTAPNRNSGLAAVFDWAVRAGTIASSSGRATVAPTPLRNVRLGSDFLVMNMTCYCASIFTRI